MRHIKWLKRVDFKANDCLRPRLSHLIHSTYGELELVTIYAKKDKKTKTEINNNTAVKAEKLGYTSKCCQTAS